MEIGRHGKENNLYHIAFVCFIMVCKSPDRSERKSDGSSERSHRQCDCEGCGQRKDTAFHDHGHERDV